MNDSTAHGSARPSARPSAPRSARVRRRRIGLAVGAIAIAATAPWVAPREARAAVPHTIAVQAVLSAAAGGPVADGAYHLSFALYPAATGGKALWSEGPVQVAVFGGRFAYALGSTSKLDAAAFGSAAQLWIGVRVGADPELPRRRLHAVLFALRAETASRLACSGCVKNGQLAAGAVTPSRVNFTWAGSGTKGGPADKALDLQCSGCVSVAEMVFDGDLDLKGRALKAAKVTANVFVGDGSRLTGIKTPAGACAKAGEVVRGIDANGKLLCAPALGPGALGPDLIDEVSNGLIWNQFDDLREGTKGKPIPDNNPLGTSDEIDFPDVGLAQKLEVDVYLKNSGIQNVTVKLFDPKNVEYLLYDKSSKGKVLTSSWPYTEAPAKGDLRTWTGRNPKGKWRLLVIDTADNGGGNDGEIVRWRLRVRTLSGKKIRVAGGLVVDGDLRVKGGATLTPSQKGRRTRKRRISIA